MLLCLTANHRNASLDVLERLSQGAPAATRTLVDDEIFVAGAVVLATCNRFEAYLDIQSMQEAARSIVVSFVPGVIGSAKATAGLMIEDLA